METGIMDAAQIEQMMAYGNMLFYGGIGLMGTAAAGAAAAAAILRVTGKRLRQKLEAEFGKKRR